jgi:hypothetical protein
MEIKFYRHSCCLCPNSSGRLARDQSLVRDVEGPDSDSIFFDVTLGGQVVPESVALEVEWLADEETIQSETFGLLQQHKGVLKEDKWTVGQTVSERKE